MMFEIDETIDAAACTKLEKSIVFDKSWHASSI
jgi:hypothetical protein